MQNKVPLFFKETCHIRQFSLKRKNMTSFYRAVGYAKRFGLLGLQSRFAVTTSVDALGIELLARLEIPRCANANTE